MGSAKERMAVWTSIRDVRAVERAHGRLGPALSVKPALCAAIIFYWCERCSHVLRRFGQLGRLAYLTFADALFRYRPPPELPCLVVFRRNTYHHVSSV